MKEMEIYFIYKGIFESSVVDMAIEELPIEREP